MKNSKLYDFVGWVMAFAAAWCTAPILLWLLEKIYFFFH